MNEQSNPYQPPVSNVEPSAVTYELALASKGKRFGTLLVDYAGCYASSFLIGVTVAVLFGREGIRFLESLPQLLIGVVVVFAYYFLFEFVWGRTPGKFALGTLVVNEHGGKPTVGQLIGRTASRFIPFEAVTFFGEAGAHDRLSGTRVVVRRKA